MAKKKDKKPAFPPPLPREVFVHWEEPSEPYLSVNTKPEDSVPDLSARRVVGRYALVETMVAEGLVVIKDAKPVPSK